MRRTGMWGGMEADECPHPNLREDRVYLARDDKSRLGYQGLGDFYEPRARRRNPHFAVAPCSSTWRSTLANRFVKLGLGSPLERLTRAHQWTLFVAREDYANVKELSLLMSGWLRHGNWNEADVYSGRAGRWGSIAIDEQGWAPFN